MGDEDKCEQIQNILQVRSMIQKCVVRFPEVYEVLRTLRVVRSTEQAEVSVDLVLGKLRVKLCHQILSISKEY